MLVLASIPPAFPKIIQASGIAALWPEKLLTLNNKIVNRIELNARLIGQAKKDRLAPSFNPLDVGAGIVQAPLDEMR